MRGLAPKLLFPVENVGGVTIPPFSVVLVVGTSTSADGSSTWSRVKQYDGTAGNIMVTTEREIPAFRYDPDSSTQTQINGRGSAAFDEFLYVAVDSTGPSAAGDEWGPVSGQWTIGASGAGFVSQGTVLSDSDPLRGLFYRNSGSSGGGGGTTSCGCCEIFSCASIDQINIVGCTYCPNGATYKYYWSIGIWSAYPDASQAFLYFDGGCVWKSEEIDVGGGATYQWVRTVTATEITTELVHISGSDPMDLDGAYHVIYKTVGQWSCICETKMEPYQPEKFPPNRAGLNTTVCVSIIDVPCSCCLSLTVAGFTGEICSDFNQDGSGTWSVYQNCTGFSGYDETGEGVCHFIPAASSCCDGSGDTCWNIVYDRETRTLTVSHPGVDGPSHLPLYKIVLEADQSICSIGEEGIDVPFNDADYPDGLQCEGQDFPASVHVAQFDCAGNVPPTPCSEELGRCCYTDDDGNHCVDDISECDCLELSLNTCWNQTIDGDITCATPHVGGCTNCEPAPECGTCHWKVILDLDGVTLVWSQQSGSCTGMCACTMPAGPPTPLGAEVDTNCA